MFTARHIGCIAKNAPERIQVKAVLGSGCYGHNGADDVAADAALLARAYPGRHVRLQWLRDDEHAWEPYGSAMLTQPNARLLAQPALPSPASEVSSAILSQRRAAVCYTQPTPGGALCAGAAARVGAAGTGRFWKCVCAGVLYG